MSMNCTLIVGIGVLQEVTQDLRHLALSYCRSSKLLCQCRAVIHLPETSWQICMSEQVQRLAICVQWVTPTHRTLSWRGSSSNIQQSFGQQAVVLDPTPYRASYFSTALIICGSRLPAGSIWCASSCKESAILVLDHLLTWAILWTSRTTSATVLRQASQSESLSVENNLLSISCSQPSMTLNLHMDSQRFQSWPPDKLHMPALRFATPAITFKTNLAYTGESSSASQTEDLLLVWREWGFPGVFIATQVYCTGSKTRHLN